MNPRRDPIPVKLNGPALELKPKRNTAPGEGRPSQRSDLAGAKGVIVRRLVSTKAVQERPFYFTVAYTLLTSKSDDHSYIQREVHSTSLLNDGRYDLRGEPPTTFLLSAARKCLLVVCC